MSLNSVLWLTYILNLVVSSYLNLIISLISLFNKKYIIEGVEHKNFYDLVFNYEFYSRLNFYKISYIFV